MRFNKKESAKWFPYGALFSLFCSILVMCTNAKPSMPITPMENDLAASYIHSSSIFSETVKVSNSNIHYLRVGPEPSKSKRVIIFCHGAAFTSYTWQLTGVLDELGIQGFSAVALDLPGCFCMFVTIFCS